MAAGRRISAVRLPATQLSAHLSVPREQMLFFTFFLFLCGCMLYIIIITLLVYRLSFFEMHAEDFAPPYWINMGAVAIFAIRRPGHMIFLALRITKASRVTGLVGLRGEG
ncbi:MAG: hypothetical protein M3Y60_04075 [Bacteroidota bacterium]|nr:hypothetical protein [Bacteroidota bacterium]